MDGLFPDEALEPLGGDMSIIQPRPGTGYRFGKDSIALACFACEHLRRGARVLELCSGCGIVAITLAVKADAEVVGAEINERMADMAERSARRNGLGKVRFAAVDIRDIAALKGSAGGPFDAVVCNPPFYKADSRAAAVAPEASSELTVELRDVVAAARAVLGQRGEFFLVYTATRLDEAVQLCREAGLTPKDMVMDFSGKTFLLRCVRGGRSGLNVKIKEFSCYTS